MSKAFIDNYMKLMQRVNICSVDPSFSRPLQSTLACGQLTSGPHGLMAAHSCIINAWNLSEFVGFCLSTHLLRIDHKFSMGLRSGEFPGHGPKISMFCSPRAPYGKVLHHAGKGIVHRQTVPGWLGEVALGGCVCTILYSWLCS